MPCSDREVFLSVEFYSLCSIIIINTGINGVDANRLLIILHIGITNDRNRIFRTQKYFYVKIYSFYCLNLFININSFLLQTILTFPLEIEIMNSISMFKPDKVVVRLKKKIQNCRNNPSVVGKYFPTRYPIFVCNIKS